MKLIRFVDSNSIFNYPCNLNTDDIEEGSVAMSLYVESIILFCLNQSDLVLPMPSNVVNMTSDPALCMVTFICVKLYIYECRTKAPVG